MNLRTLNLICIMRNGVSVIYITVFMTFKDLNDPGSIQFVSILFSLINADICMPNHQTAIYEF